MLEILILLMAVLAARKGRGRKQPFRYTAIPQSIAITLSTLADDTVIVQGTETVLTQDFWVTSVKWFASLRDNTSGQDPIYFGIALAEYTVAEILEALKAAPTSAHDVPAVEHATRYVRNLGIFVQKDTASAATSLRGKAKLNIRVPAGKALPSFWAWNRSGASLTTGSIIQVEATYFGQWR